MRRPTTILLAFLVAMFGRVVELRGQEDAAELGAPVRDRERSFRRYVKSWQELKRENIVMQQRDYSCGAAALATLIRYHWGDSVTETELLLEAVRMLTMEEIRDRVENGLSLTDLRKLAVRKGYLSTIGRLDLDKLGESKIPLLVGLVVNGYEHFAVYRGMDDYYVYLADPSRGKVRTPIDEFAEQWQENAVLVVVKRGAEPDRTSALTISEEEKSLGELNQHFLRDRLTTDAAP